MPTYSWIYTDRTCIRCGEKIEFRYTFKAAEFKNVTHWVNIHTYAEAILCPHCQSTVYVKSIKTLAAI